MDEEVVMVDVFITSPVAASSPAAVAVVAGSPVVAGDAWSYDGGSVSGTGGRSH